MKALLFDGAPRGRHGGCHRRALGGWLFVCVTEPGSSGWAGASTEGKQEPGARDEPQPGRELVSAGQAGCKGRLGEGSARLYTLPVG